MTQSDAVGPSETITSAATHLVSIAFKSGATLEGIPAQYSSPRPPGGIDGAYKLVNDFRMYLAGTTTGQLPKSYHLGNSIISLEFDQISCIYLRSV